MGDKFRGSLMAVVPMKPLSEAKGRLADVLEGTARVDLSRELLVRTITVLKQARGVTRVAVVSRDEQVLSIARGLRAWAVCETGHGLNEALEQAAREAKGNGVRTFLVVPADLPELNENDVAGLIELGRQPPCVVIAPDRREIGTNALLVNPTGLISFAFGESSFAEHQRRAALKGRVEIYRSERIAFDLDLPEDVGELRHTSLGISQPRGRD